MEEKMYQKLGRCKDASSSLKAEAVAQILACVISNRQWCTLQRFSPFINSERGLIISQVNTVFKTIPISAERSFAMGNVGLTDPLCDAVDASKL